MEEEAKYFKHVVSFQSPPFPLNDVNLKDFFPNNNNNNNHVKLTNFQKDPCEGQLTEEELFEAIKSFQSGKTPGLDDIPVEVYQTCLDVLKEPLLACFNYSYTNGRLSGTQQGGLIVTY